MQMSHGSGVTNRGGINVVGNHAFSSNMSGVGGSITGVSSSSATGNRSAVPGLGVSPVLGNVGPRLASTMGNIVGGGNMGRSISSGGLSVPGLSSRVNLGANSGSGSLSVQGSNRLISGMLQQGNTPYFLADFWLCKIYKSHLRAPLVLSTSIAKTFENLIYTIVAAIHEVGLINSYLEVFNMKFSLLQQSLTRN